MNPSAAIADLSMIACAGVETAPVSSLKRPILNDVSFTVQPGEFVSLLGLNGAGKSTLLRVLVGLTLPRQGTVHINGVPMTRKTLSQARQSVGLLLQGGGLIRQLPAIENVLCGRLGALPAWQTCWGFPKADRRQALSLLDQLGLKDQAYQTTGQLSGGQQQRVAIARALIQSPKILLVDEPIAGLDVVAARQVMDTLAQLHQQGMTIVAVLHDLAIAAQYTQRSIVLDQGRVIHDGPFTNLPEQFSRATQPVSQ